MTVTYSTDIAGGGYYSSATKTYYKTYDGAVSAESAWNQANTSPYVPVATPETHTATPSGGNQNTPPPPTYVPLPSTTPTGREIDYGDIPAAPSSTTESGREIDYGSPIVVPAPDPIRQEELISQETKWEVDGTVYDTYKEAEAAAKAPEVKTQPEPILVPVNDPDFFVDAPGMEGYVAQLNIPTTQSGLYTQGWVDAQINEVSAELHAFGVALEKSAATAKLGGNNLAAGAQAGAAVAVGVAASLFDTATFALNPFDKDTVNVIDEFAENPLFDTGYVGGQVAVMLYGAASLKESLKGKNLDDLKNWLDDADRFIDVNPQIKSPTKGIAFEGEYDEQFREVATEWPEGSDERVMGTITRGTPTAYAMVDSDSLYVAAMTPLDLDAPLFYYPTSRPFSPTVAAALTALGATSVTNSLLSRNQQIIEEIKTGLRTRDINEVVTRQVYVPRTIVETLPLTEQKPASETEIIQQLNTIADAIVQQDTITEQTPIQEQPPIQEPATTPDLVPVLDVPVVPVEYPPEEPSRPGPPKLKGEPVLTKREDVKRRRSELAAPTFTVRMRYGRKSVTRVVEAESFHGALAKVLRGTPSEVEVRRRG